jgi:hypothetical protein
MNIDTKNLEYKKFKADTLVGIKKSSGIRAAFYDDNGKYRKIFVKIDSSDSWHTMAKKIHDATHGQSMIDSLPEGEISNVLELPVEDPITEDFLDEIAKLQDIDKPTESSTLDNMKKEVTVDLYHLQTQKILGGVRLLQSDFTVKTCELAEVYKATRDGKTITGTIVAKYLLDSAMMNSLQILPDQTVRFLYEGQ